MCVCTLLTIKSFYQSRESCETNRFKKKIYHTNFAKVKTLGNLIGLLRNVISYNFKIYTNKIEMCSEFTLFIDEKRIEVALSLRQALIPFESLTSG